MALGAPVDEARGAVHEPVLVQAHEGLPHGAVHVRVHRELGPPPVGRRPEHPLLLGDAPSALGLPLPDPLLELDAAELVTRLALALELTLDDRLGRDPRVVDAGLPERVEAPHAVPADERVLERAALRVAHVQGARHVWRRHRDDVGGAHVVRVVVGLEDAVLLPERVPARLDLARVVAFGEIGRAVVRRARVGHGRTKYHNEPRRDGKRQAGPAWPPVARGWTGPATEDPGAASGRALALRPPWSAARSLP